MKIDRGGFGWLSLSRVLLKSADMSSIEDPPMVSPFRMYLVRPLPSIQTHLDASLFGTTFTKHAIFKMYSRGTKKHFHTNSSTSFKISGFANQILPRISLQFLHFQALSPQVAGMLRPKSSLCIVAQPMLQCSSCRLLKLCKTSC